VIVCEPVPTTSGVYVNEQLAEAPLPDSVQTPAALNVPTPVLVKLTVPVGVVGVPVSVSETVAVQEVEVPAGRVVGEQVRLVLVDRGSAVTRVVPSEPRCVASPP
jgi:hypothetical protein